MARFRAIDALTTITSSHPVASPRDAAHLVARMSRGAQRSIDLRRFHTVVLGAGAVTLPVLDDRVRAWIEAQRSR